jgi:TRAP-type mannitol/chloroaromatic compound transport system permease large subunit
MGIEIGIEWLSLLLFGGLGLLLMLGLPMAFCTGSLATIFLFVFGNSAVLNMMPSRIFPFMTDYQLSAVPLFIFMAAVLERAGIIEELFDVIYKWLGALKGGLASATVIACTLLAAMVGVVGATEVTMGMIALPAMLRRNYEPKLACGALLAGGTLGILIPPSVMAIVYAVVAQQSLGELLIGSVFPGLMLSGLYIAYVTIRCYINPSLGPALPIDERVDLREKLRLLRNTITWVALYEAAMATLKATAMVMWIFFGATMFVGFFIIKGGQTFVADLIIGTGLPPYGILLLMMVVLFILGMFLDWVGILLLTVPIFLPILTGLAFHGLLGFEGVKPDDISLWYGVIFMVNMQMAFLSPPFGYSLFYLKSVAPKEISMAMIFKAAMPFIGLQAIGNALCILFPQIILWLPGVLYQGTK